MTWLTAVSYGCWTSTRTPTRSPGPAPRWPARVLRGAGLVPGPVRGFAADERPETTLAMLAECFATLGGVPGLHRAGWDDPACRLLCIARDRLEVPVVVQDIQAAGASGRSDDEVGDRGRTVLGLLGKRLLDLGSLLPDVFGDVDAVEGRFELLLHPGPFLDVPGGVQHLQFGDAADADQRPYYQRFQFLADGRQVEPGKRALVGEVAGHPHIRSSAPGSRRKSKAPDSPRATRSRTAAMRITSRNAALMVSRMDSVPRIPRTLSSFSISISTLVLAIPSPPSWISDPPLIVHLFFVDLEIQDAAPPGCSSRRPPWPTRRRRSPSDPGAHRPPGQAMWKARLGSSAGSPFPARSRASRGGRAGAGAASSWWSRSDSWRMGQNLACIISALIIKSGGLTRSVSVSVLISLGVVCITFFYWLAFRIGRLDLTVVNRLQALEQT